MCTCIPCTDLYREPHVRSSAQHLSGIKDSVHTHTLSHPPSNLCLLYHREYAAWAPRKADSPESPQQHCLESLPLLTRHSAHVRPHSRLQVRGQAPRKATLPSCVSGKKGPCGTGQRPPRTVGILSTQSTSSTPVTTVTSLLAIPIIPVTLSSLPPLVIPVTPDYSYHSITSVYTYHTVTLAIHGHTYNLCHP